MAEVTPAELFTTGDAARQLGVSRARVEYAIEAYQIEPLRRVGIIRLFDGTGLQRIESALKRIGENGRGSL